MTQKPPLYRDDIINLSRSNVNAGVLPNAPSAMEVNAWCGDECRISAAFDGGRIVRSLHQTRGCILCLAAAVRATTAAMQLGDTARILELAEAFDKMMRGERDAPESLEIFAPVIPAKNRHSCVLLPFRALAKVIRAQNKT